MITNRKKIAVKLIPFLFLGALTSCGTSRDQVAIQVDLGIPVQSKSVIGRLAKVFSVSIGNDCYQDQIYLAVRNKSDGKFIETKKLSIRTMLVSSNNTLTYTPTSASLDQTIAYLKTRSFLDEAPTVLIPKTETVEVGIIGQFTQPKDDNRDGVCDQVDQSITGLNNLWIKNDEMNTPRYSHTSSILPASSSFPGGAILIAGGIKSSISGVNSEYFDLSTRTWVQLSNGNLNTPRYDHTATTLSDGRVVVIGGKIDLPNVPTTPATPATPPTNATSIEIFEPSLKKWEKVLVPPAGFNPGIHSHTATRLPDDTILVIGGFDGTSSINQAGIYNPSANTWTALPPLSVPRESHVTTVIGNKVVVMGGKKYESGSAETFLSSILVLDLKSPNNWRPYTPNPPNSPNFQRIGFTATPYLGNQILIVGGKELISGTLSETTKVHLYKIEDGVLTDFTKPLSSAISGHATFILPNNRILVFGSSTQIYDPLTPTWQTYTATDQVVTPREKFTAHQFSNGSIMAIGGSPNTSSTQPIQQNTAETFFTYSPAQKSSALWGHTTVDTKTKTDGAVSIDVQVLHSTPTANYSGNAGSMSIDSFSTKSNWMILPPSFSTTVCINSPCVADLSTVKYFRSENDFLIKAPVRGLSTSTNFYFPAFNQAELIFDAKDNSGLFGRYKATVSEGNGSSTISAELIPANYNRKGAPNTISGIYNIRRP
jgi:hypothetical protein